MQKLVDLVSARPQVLLAALILFAAVVLPWTHLGAGPNSSPSLLVLPIQSAAIKNGLASGASDIQNQESVTTSTQATASGAPIVISNGPASLSPAQRQALADIAGASGAVAALMLGWAVIAGAAAVIVLAWRGHGHRGLEIGTGALALVVVAVTLSLDKGVAAVLGPQTQGLMHNGGVGLASGAWLTALAGLGLIVAGLGLIRRKAAPAAKPA